jgi:iron(III) transport system permease protein
VVTSALAFALAFVVNRAGMRAPRLFRAVMLLPLVAPPVLVATATIMLFGRSELVTDALLERHLGLLDADVTNIYGLSGILLAEVLSFVPAIIIVIDNALGVWTHSIHQVMAAARQVPARKLRAVLS